MDKRSDLEGHLDRKVITVIFNAFNFRFTSSLTLSHLEKTLRWRDEDGHSRCAQAAVWTARTLEAASQVPASRDGDMMGGDSRGEGGVGLVPEEWGAGPGSSNGEPGEPCQGPEGARCEGGQAWLGLGKGGIEVERVGTVLSRAGGLTRV